ncbi:hypothetical protein ASG25_15570 [Rhizobium sp. Leaf384]|uniref:hypothetical protein n=1 Tax=unclassified Rhizobium TaxID=2613769 RepID=UPI0007153E2A|nr:MULTISPECIES: hypothetical protein [unclassified Rhizobium]KQS76837.1 hypothetical protein ASG25_15570 [Rhizobium sp. Leaf384]KQS78108.1 hypothetical protein ASG58_06785 [Rhizobium sp. Leaf383]
MTIAPPSPNQKRMDAIRRRVGAAMPDWTVMADETGTFVMAADGPDSERVYRVEDDANLDNREMALSAPEDLRFLLRMYDALVKHLKLARPSEASSRKHANYAAECAMKCDDRRFREYLQTCHGVDTSDGERIATRIRSILSIKSRADLNDNAEAAGRWRKLVGDFDAWSRTH